MRDESDWDWDEIMSSRSGVLLILVNTAIAAVVWAAVIYVSARG